MVRLSGVHLVRILGIFGLDCGFPPRMVGTQGLTNSAHDLQQQPAADFQAAAVCVLASVAGW